MIVNLGLLPTPLSFGLSPMHITVYMLYASSLQHAKYSIFLYFVALVYLHCTCTCIILYMHPFLQYCVCTV